jgi:hypothetical protein
MNTTEDPLRALAAVNPLPATAEVALAKPERDALLQHIYEEGARREEGAGRSRPTRSRRLLVAGISIAIAASVIPAAALSGRLSSLFDFSNRGTADVPEAQQLNNLRVADRLGLQPGSTIRLAERSGVVFYTVRGKDQRQCFGISAGPRAKSTFTTLMCPSGDGGTAFPSPSRPVLDLSPIMGRDGSTRLYFPRIKGFAADGVAEVGVVDLDGRTHTIPVEGNVYFAENLADVAAQALVALDAHGEVVWRREVPKFWKFWKSWTTETDRGR